MRIRIALTAACVLLLAACGPKWQETEADGFKLVNQKGGATPGYRNGALDPYEDWRLPADTRAKDLAAQLSIEEIAGLMLYSGHQAVRGPEITDPQKKLAAIRRSGGRKSPTRRRSSWRKTTCGRSS